MSAMQISYAIRDPPPIISRSQKKKKGEVELKRRVSIYQRRKFRLTALAPSSFSELVQRQANGSACLLHGEDLSVVLAPDFTTSSHRFLPMCLCFSLTGLVILMGIAVRVNLCWMQGGLSGDPLRPYRPGR
jgi:hypothetical protein